MTYGRTLHKESHQTQGSIETMGTHAPLFETGWHNQSVKSLQICEASPPDKKIEGNQSCKDAAEVAASTLAPVDRLGGGK